MTKHKDGIQINREDCTGVITLSAAHSMVMGHAPSKIRPEQLSNQLIEASNTNIESFGLFEQATPNYTTYYPDVTADDLNPKEEDFIEPVFRLLSETIVSKGWRPIDFSKPGILKKSMQMLLGQTVNIDHEVAVGNAIGAVSEVYWQASYKTKSGIIVPAGINGKLKIDGKSNPRIARGIMMNPPSIHSNSVTVRFKWEKSHKDEEDNSFYSKLGTYDKDGKLYRLVVTDIMGYSETSLVSHGADMWAQKINDKNEIVNPEYAERQSFSKSEDGKFISSCIEIDYKNEMSFSAEDNTIPAKLNTTKDTKHNDFDMKEIIKQLEVSFGFEEGTINEENLAAKIAEAHTANLNRIQELESDKANLETEKASLETEKSDLETQLTEKDTTIGDLETTVETFKAVEQETNTEAVRLYKLAKGDDADENILALIAKADFKTSKSFIEQYGKEVDEKFEATCKSCGGKEIDRASAAKSTEGLADKDSKGGKAPKTNKEAMQSLQQKKRKKGFFN